MKMMICGMLISWTILVLVLYLVKEELKFQKNKEYLMQEQHKKMIFGVKDIR